MTEDDILFDEAYELQEVIWRYTSLIIIFHFLNNFVSHSILGAHVVLLDAAPTG